MGWVEARDRIVAIVEATTVTTKKSGMPGRFHYDGQASVDGPVPDSRVFWFDTETGIVVTGPLMPSAQAGRTRIGLRLVVAYAISLSPATALEIMLEDYDAIGRRLRDDSLWDRPTSTIESIDIGGSLQGQARIDKNKGGHFLTFEIPLEFRG